MVITVRRVGGAQTRLTHADQTKPFVFHKETPKELQRAREPARPSKKDQLRIVDTEENDQSDDNSDNTSVDDAEYEVEQIIGHFHTPRGFWFLVKWSGFVQPTWEHESALNAPRLVTEYFKHVCQGET